MKGRRLNSGINSRPIIGSDFGTTITSQYRPQLSSKPRSIIGPISIANIGCQHCELGPIIGPIILSYMGSDLLVYTGSLNFRNDSFGVSNFESERAKSTNDPRWRAPLGEISSLREFILRLWCSFPYSTAGGTSELVKVAKTNKG